MSDWNLEHQVVSEGAGVQAPQWPEWMGKIQPRQPFDAPQPDIDQPKPREEAFRSRGPATTTLTREELATRPTVVFVGTISSDIEVGLGSPTTVGQLIRRVRLRARSVIAASTDNYWTMFVYWYDASGSPSLIGEFSTAQQSIPRSRELAVWHLDSGVRVEPLHEVTIKFVKTGSPPSISNATLYPDWFAGI